MKAIAVNTYVVDVGSFRPVVFSYFLYETDMTDQTQSRTQTHCILIHVV